MPFPVAAMAIVRSELSQPVARMMVLTARNYSPADARCRWVFWMSPTDGAGCCRGDRGGDGMAALPHSMYGRIKRELRGEALARIDDAISNRNEPMLESWLSAETSAASAMALKRKH